MGSFSDKKLIEGIIKKRRGTIHFMYRDYFPLILALVEKNSGNFQDAEDIFQDALVALYLRCRNKELVLSCSLRSYFYSICQNLWLQRLERKYKVMYQPDLIVNEHAEKYYAMESITKEQKLARHRIFWKHFKELPEDCQKVLMMYIDKIPFKEVAEKLELSDANCAKMKKYHCKKLFIERVRKDPEFQDCVNNE